MPSGEVSKRGPIEGLRSGERSPDSVLAEVEPIGVRESASASGLAWVLGQGWDWELASGWERALGLEWAWASG